MIKNKYYYNKNSKNYNNFKKKLNNWKVILYKIFFFIFLLKFKI